MPATRADINRWLDDLYADEQHSHMVVKCDSFEYRGNPDDQCCYPVYVEVGKDPREVAAGGDRTMEVYSRNHTREEQLAKKFCFNYD